MTTIHTPTLTAEREVEEPKGTISFSVRLTEKQRDLLSRAAEKRGWSLSSLLKSAALEKAVHILNTSAPNRVDFRGTAEEIARQVFTPRSLRTAEGYPDPPELYESLEYILEEQIANAAELSPWHQPPDFLERIRDAARYGGIEFLDLIIQVSEAITSRHHGHLPDPIDPSSI